MTKQEAIASMRLGNKLTHISFLPSEWNSGSIVLAPTGKLAGAFGRTVRKFLTVEVNGLTYQVAQVIHFQNKQSHGSKIQKSSYAGKVVAAIQIHYGS